jgi:hypothetical protein
LDRSNDWTSEYVFPFLPYDTNCPALLNWFMYNEWEKVAFQQWARDQVISGPNDGLVLLRSADPGDPFQINFDIRTIAAQVCSQIKSLTKHYEFFCKS